MRSKAVLSLVFVSVLLFSIIAGTAVLEKGTSVTQSGESGQGIMSGSGLSDGVDWWPMFHHDLTRSGCSTSKSPKTNATLWIYSMLSGYDPYFSSPTVADGRVHIGSLTRVFTLNATDGALIWTYTTGWYVHSSPAIADGKVYVGSEDDKVYCLNASTGTLAWSYTTGDDVDSSPAVTGGRVYIGSADKKVYCLNASTGTLIWNYTTGAYVYSSPAVVGDKVFVGSGDRSVYCLNATTGAFIWKYTTGWAIEQSSPAVAGGVVYIGSGDFRVYALNASTGTLIWNYYTSPNGKVWSSPAVAGGRVYVGSEDKKVYCLNASTGTPIWSYTTSSGVRSSPAVSGAVVYVGSADSKVYCLNASTGTLVWRYTTGGYMYSSPAIAAGKVYACSLNKVYAFGSHDVAIASVASSTTEVYSGQMVNITVVAKNKGTFNETFNINAYYDSNLVGTKTVTDLPADEPRTLTFCWNTTNVAGGYYTISANATVVTGETRTADNNLVNGTVKITSPVRIKEVIPCNQTGYPENTFHKGAMAYFKVTINSTALIPQNTLVTINLYDNLGIPIGTGSFQAPIMSGISTVIFGVPIPAWAFTGTATVYANCYTDWPSQGGFPHCPEMSATLEITGP